MAQQMQSSQPVPAPAPAHINHGGGGEESKQEQLLAEVVEVSKAIKDGADSNLADWEDLLEISKVLDKITIKISPKDDGKREEELHVSKREELAMLLPTIKRALEQRKQPQRQHPPPPDKKVLAASGCYPFKSRSSPQQQGGGGGGGQEEEEATVSLKLLLRLTDNVLQPVQYYEWTTSYVDESRIYGWDKDAGHVVDALVGPEDGGGDKRLFRAAGIAGIHGSGKTALAQKVFVHGRVKDNFPLRLWVCVGPPDSEDRFDLLYRMLDNLGLDTYKVESIVGDSEVVRTATSKEQERILMEDATAVEDMKKKAHDMVEEALKNKKSDDATKEKEETVKKPNDTIKEEEEEAVKKPDDATKEEEEEVTKKPDDATKEEEEATKKLDDATKEEEATKKPDDATKEEEEATKKLDDATKEEEEEAAKKPNDATKEEEEVAKKPDDTTKEEEAAKKPDDATKEEEEAAKKPDDATKEEEEEAAKKPNDVTKEEEEAAKKPDDATKEEEEAAKKPDDATKEKEEATKKLDDATKEKEEAAKKPDDTSKEKEETAKKPDNATKKEEEAAAGQNTKEQEDLMFKKLLKKKADDCPAVQKSKIGVLLYILHVTLSRTGYLIVFDDIRVYGDDGWYSNLTLPPPPEDEWGDRLAYGLPKGNHKSAVLVTCRKEDDARAMVRTGRVFRPPKLELEDGWKLFETEYNKAKENLKKDGKDAKGEDMLFKDLEQMKKEIVNKCLGLPVAIAEAARGFAALEPLPDPSPQEQAAAAAKPAEDQTVSSKKDKQAEEEEASDKSAD